MFGGDYPEFGPPSLLAVLPPCKAAGIEPAYVWDDRLLGNLSETANIASELRIGLRHCRY